MEKLEEIDKIKQTLEQHINEEIEEELSGIDIADNLKILKKHDEEEYSKYLEMLNPQSLADAAVEMPGHMLKDVLEILPNDKIVEAIEELESDDQAELLSSIDEIDEQKAKEIFSALDKDDQEDILTLSKYENNQAGAYMQTEIFSSNTTDTLREAVDRLRDLIHNEEIENVYNLFAVDNDGVLKYSIPISELIIYNFSLTIEEVVKIAQEDKFRPKFAIDTDEIETVAMKFEEFDLSVLPVVNENGVLVGRITSENIHDFIQERATEQIYNFVGVDEDTELEETAIKAAKSRALWLFINLITSFASAFVIAYFSDEIEKLVALAALMPIVASMGGNAGSQALAVTVRRLALGQIDFSDAKEVLKREILISFFNGIIFACTLGIVAYFWFKMPLLGVVIAISIIINLAIAGFVGSIVPMTLKKINIDPAVGSSVILTAVTDTLGFFCFLALAKVMLL